MMCGCSGRPGGGAQSLARAVSHTATAAGNHWDVLVKGRRTRRLQIALDIMADRGQITAPCPA